MISLKSVCKSYLSGDGQLQVLKQTDLNIKKADFAVVAGPSGSGKSTLLNLIGGLDSPDSGLIEIDGVELSRLSDSQQAGFRNRKIGFVFQSFHLIPVLTAAENVAWPLYIKGVNRKQRMARASELLSHLGLATHIDKQPAKLSGGQCQRVAIARALACEPQIVLADEPTANLDRKTSVEIMDLLCSLNKQSDVTFLFSTHDQMVAAYAERHLYLEDGKLIEHSADAHINKVYEGDESNEDDSRA